MSRPPQPHTKSVLVSEIVIKNKVCNPHYQKIHEGGIHGDLVGLEDVKNKVVGTLGTTVPCRQQKVPGTSLLGGADEDLGDGSVHFRLWWLAMGHV